PDGVNRPASVDELLQGASRKATTPAEQEEKLLDFMEWSLAVAPSVDPKSVAERTGKWLATLELPQWAEWFAATAWSPEAWDAVQELVAELRRQEAYHLLLHPAVLHFVIDGYLGIRKRQSKRGRKKHTNLWRDSVIAVTVEMIADLGHRTRWDESGNSACDAVATRLSEEHKKLQSTPKLGRNRVHGVWREYRRQRSGANSPG
ncbi:MAG: hypothetical protein OXG35_15775, partial [Acidobacteria bacterium]|nr:hypothetical protein [Acidobacteriota bacterium]